MHMKWPLSEMHVKISVFGVVWPWWQSSMSFRFLCRMQHSKQVNILRFWSFTRWIGHGTVYLVQSKHFWSSIFILCLCCWNTISRPIWNNILGRFFESPIIFAVPKNNSCSPHSRLQPSQCYQNYCCFYIHAAQYTNLQSKIPTPADPPCVLLELTNLSVGGVFSISISLDFVVLNPGGGLASKWALDLTLVDLCSITKDFLDQDKVE